MPKTAEELEKMFNEMAEKQERTSKEFQLKLDTAEKNAKQYKEIAEATEEKLRKYQQENEAKEKEQNAALAKARENEISVFVEAQVKAGRIIPAVKNKFVAFMKSLTSEGTALEFTETNGAKVSHSQLSLFKEILMKLKPVVPVSQEYSITEEQTEELPEGEEAPAQEFMQVREKGEIKNYPVEGADFAAKAFEYIEAQAKLGKTVDYGSALIAVSPKRKISAKA